MAQNLTLATRPQPLTALDPSELLKETRLKATGTGRTFEETPRCLQPGQAAPGAALWPGWIHLTVE